MRSILILLGSAVGLFLVLPCSTHRNVNMAIVSTILELDYALISDWTSNFHYDSSLFLKNKFIYLFIYGCVGSSLLLAGFL